MQNVGRSPLDPSQLHSYLAQKPFDLYLERRKSAPRRNALKLSYSDSLSMLQVEELRVCLQNLSETPLAV